jgi:hypothetical protein
MINDYFAYDYIAMKPLYSHNKMDILCNKLWLEGEEQYTIIRLDSTHIFDKHTIAQLKVFYERLGGDKTKMSSERNALLMQCIKLAVLFPRLEVNGFQLEVQCRDKEQLKR